MHVPWHVPILNEEMKEKALAVLATGTTYGGPESQRFEVEVAQSCGMRYGVAANSGTSVTMLTLEALGVKAGEEVIMAANTYSGVLTATVKLGAVPIFVEADGGTGNILPEAAAAAITPRTRVIIPVHMYGFPCDMAPILEAAAKHDVFVLEDAAQAMGAEYKGRRVGGIGGAGFFSFSRKMITTFGPGGAVVTNDHDLALEVSALADQGRPRLEEISFIRRTDATWYDQKWMGYNMHLSEVSAALGRIQLRMLPEFLKKRHAAAAYYTQRFQEAALPITLPPQRPWAKPAYLHYLIQTKARDGLRDFLQAREIEPLICYPVPLHLLDPVRDRYGTKAGQFPEAERLCRENIELPVGPYMTHPMLEHVADTVIAFFQDAADHNTTATGMSVRS